MSKGSPATASKEVSAADEVAVPRRRESKHEDKWGKPIVALGWTAIPNILIQRQQTLGLTPTHLNILVQLLMYWWDDSNPPHPTKRRLAESMGVSESTVQRGLREMERAGFLRRIIRKQEKDRNLSNQYDLSPLRRLLEPQAEEELKENQKHNDGKRRRQSTVNKIKKSGKSSDSV
ncbi:helix-turn-helix domain-containing protein [Salinicola aestuarinus]|uniref:helix-turn-helix domain-containing protein n=1 Tax=Salinicola aestuarinus TaxID=1949082 RepID=UPI000DA145CD